VRGHVPDDDTTDAGSLQPVFVKVTRADTGSARVGDDSPALNHRPLTPGAALTMQVPLGHDHRGRFDVTLGVGGDDVVTIAIGSTPDCLDAEIEVTTRRRVLVHPMFTWKPDQAEVGQMQQRVLDAFADSGVELEFQPVTELQQGDVPSFCFTTGDHVRAMGYRTRLDEYTAHQADFDEANPMAVIDRPENVLTQRVPADGRSHLLFVVANAIVWKVKRKVTLSFRGKSSGWKKFPVAKHEGKWVPRFFDDADDADPRGTFLQRPSGALGDWEAGRKEQPAGLGTFGLDEVEVDEAKGKYRITLDDDAIGTFTPVRVEFAFYYLSGLGGSSTGPRVSLVWGGSDTPVKVGHALAHEIGHSLHQTVVTLDGRRHPGLTTAHPYAHTHKHYVGSHCSAGISPSQRAQDDYGKLTLKGIHGTCVMWGGVGPKFDFAKAPRFCPDCLRFLRATGVRL
jgi:hypothetical protein